jgi:hypothetical protein
MYGSEDSDWHQSLQALVSAAAVTEFAAGPAVGETWKLVAVAGFHDEAANHDLMWSLRQGGSTLDFHDPVTRAQHSKHGLYDYVKCAKPIQLRYGDYIVLKSTVVLAAGKKLYMNILTDVLVGVAA